MKLIVCGLEALSGYVSREFYYIITDLITGYGWKQIETRKLWKGPGTVKRTLLDKFGVLPDTILFWECYEFLNAHAADISRLDCHKVILADDLHWRDNQTRREQLIAIPLCEMVLSTYAYVWDECYPQLALAKVVWIPHSASPDFMLPYNRQPDNAILLSGAINRYYPLRGQMEELNSQGCHSIACHPHPGYHCGYHYREKGDVGRGYAVKINKCRAGFTDSSIYNYIVAKYFEIPATGALLFADDSVSEPLRSLGFIENQHYLPVSKEDLEAKVRYVRDARNHPELDQIRKSGQELVWERHKTSDRAREINEACKGHNNWASHS